VRSGVLAPGGGDIESFRLRSMFVALCTYYIISGNSERKYVFEAGHSEVVLGVFALDVSIEEVSTPPRLGKLLLVWSRTSSSTAHVLCTRAAKKSAMSACNSIGGKTSKNTESTYCCWPKLPI